MFEFREYEENAFRAMEVQICSETNTVQFCTWDHGGDHPTAPSVAIDWSKARELAQWILNSTPPSSPGLRALEQDKRNG